MIRLTFGAPRARVARGLAVGMLIALAVPTTAGEAYVAGVSAVASSEQVKGLTGAENLVNDHGFRETKPGSGEFALTRNLYADGGCMWHSNYLASGPQENPLVEFDFGRVATLSGFHVWNQNENPNRGFREVSAFASDDGKAWRTVPQRFTFARAPGEDGYLGERHEFAAPVRARFVRFWADSTYRGGQPDVAGLGKVRFIESNPGAAADAKTPPPVGPYPFDAGALDVKDAPFGAKGDGVTDDTDALQRAVDATQGSGRYLYLPPGTYLVSRTIRWEPGLRHGRNNLRGAGRDRSVIRLKDQTFTDPANPRPVIMNGFHGKEGGHVSADWFHNHMTDFTVDTGRGNAGAVGVQFYSNNVGRLSEVTIRSSDGAGVIGLDLGAVDQNGPLLVKDVSVIGFDTGVRTAASVNSQVIETLRLRGQRKVGLSGSGQCLTLRDVVSENGVPAMTFEYGVVALVDAELTGAGPAVARSDAITSGETLFARNVRTAGYARAIRNADARGGGTPDAAGPAVQEWVSAKPLTMGGAEPRSLNLPVRPTPPTPTDDEPTTWANVRHYRSIGDPDDTLALQRAIDSGARTVYFPPGPAYDLGGVVEVRGRVRRLAGMFSSLRASGGGRRSEIRVAAGDAPAVFIEDLHAAVPITNPSGRTLVLRNGELRGGTPTDAGELFIENVVCEWTFGAKQQVWARQLNAEAEGTHLTNAGGTLWVLGLKTERGGTLIDTRAGGRTEVIGGLSYTTTEGKLAPMFAVSEGAEMSIVLGEVCYTGDPFATLARCGKESLKRGAAPLRPAFLQGSVLPLLRATDGPGRQ